MIRLALLAPETKSALTKAGWVADIDNSELVKRFETQFFANEPFELHSLAREVLAQLGGMRFEQSGEGRTVARRSFWFDPTGAQGESDRFAEFEGELGARLCPVGEADDGETYLAIAEDGRVICLMDDGWLVGTCIEDALNSLVLGEVGDPIYV